ncbi:hypothetical protein HDU67_009196 [Dinochytrium kinnereticum]|nr:hypothetical protein HDU67_009196 [Dinochytrium kinnereticum]
MGQTPTSLKPKENFKKMTVVANDLNQWLACIMANGRGWPLMDFQLHNYLRMRIEIGAVSPFWIPSDPNDEASVLSAFVNAVNAHMCYNALLWYINRVNNDSTILPDTRIEIVPINSRLDRGVSLTSAQQLINQDRVVGIIGEVASRNTVTMAVAAAVNNVLHCANMATTPQLGNKIDYPTTFRTQSTALLQAKGILSVVNHYNRTSIGIFSSNDEFGTGMTQSLQLYAASYNISVSAVAVYDITKSDYREDLQVFINGGIQTIVIIASQSPVVDIMRSASQLNMLDGSYWMISTTGWTEAMFAASSAQAVLSTIPGVWQVQTPLFEDGVLLPDGSNAEAVALRSWHLDMFVSNEAPMFPGVSKNFNPSRNLMPLTAATASYVFPSNCPNSTQQNISSVIQKFYFPYVSGNQTITMQAAGNLCMGPNNAYIEGYTSIFALLTQNMITKPSDYQQNTIKCAKLMVGAFDHYIKAGKITVEGINNRQILSAANGNITQLINNANITDVFGMKMILDSSGDLQMEQDIWNYKVVNITSRKRGIQGVTVGRWWRENNSVAFNSEPLLFLGGKTAPPPPPIIPIIQFAAKRSMRYAFDGIVGLCSLFTIGLFCYMLAYSKMKIFMASSPNFLALILVGANISYIGVYLFSIYPMASGSRTFGLLPSDESCVTFGWLKYLGFAVVFGALLVKVAPSNPCINKTYRISVIFVNKKNKIRKLNDSVMLIYFTAIVAVWVVILVIWTVIPSQRPYLKVESIANVARNGTILNFYQTPVCEFNNYNFVCLGAMVITLGVGVYLTYTVRNTPSSFNESKWIAIGIYNWVVIGIVLNAISNFAVKDPDVIFVMEALVVILTQTGVAAALFVPKIMEIMGGRGNNNDTFMNSTSQGSEKQSTNAIGAQSSLLGIHSINADDGSKKLEDMQRLIKNKETAIGKLEAELHAVKVENSELKVENSGLKAKLQK